MSELSLAASPDCGQWAAVRSRLMCWALAREHIQPLRLTPTRLRVLGVRSRLGHERRWTMVRWALGVVRQ